MATIIPDITKGKLTKGLQYPLHYSDIEAVLSGSPADPLCLSAWFYEHQAYAKDEREHLAAEGRLHLVEAEYRGSETRAPLFYYSPWKEMEDPTIVSATIYAVPHTDLVDSHLTRPRLRGILAGELDRIGRRTLFANRWRVRLDLLLDDLVVEGVTETWTGLRAEPERRFRVGLMEEDRPPGQ